MSFWVFNKSWWKNISLLETCDNCQNFIVRFLLFYIISTGVKWFHKKIGSL